MARRKEPSPADLYSDIAQPTATDILAARQARQELLASTRGDMGGTHLTMLVHPRTYQQRAMRVWEAFSTDSFFARMVNRSIEFCANGAKWEVPSRLDEESWVEKVKKWMSRRKDAQVEREEDFWNTWADNLNAGVPNVLPGLNEITRWAVKHLLLSGMFVPAWELGEMRFGKQTFLVPTRFTCYPASAITLRRTNALFMEEEIFLKLPPGAGSKTAYLTEGAPREASPVATTSSDQLSLPPLGKGKESADTEAFALKYGWTPGDLVTMRAGQLATTGQGIYPHPPFFALMPIFAMRQKLFASDLAILDSLINFILLWRVGDEKNPPKPPVRNAAGDVVQDGTIAQVRKLIQEDRVGPALELFLPYYVNLEIKTPDTTALLSEAKYVQSTIEIFQCVRPDQLVTTRRGHIPIAEVQIGDEVLTHRGRWRSVTKVFQRHHDGDLVGLGTGTNRRAWVTPEHPVLMRYRKKRPNWHSTQKRWRVSVVQGVEPSEPEWCAASGVEDGDLILLSTDRQDYEESVPILKLAADHAIESDGRLSLTITGRHPGGWRRAEADVVDLKGLDRKTWLALNTQEPQSVKAIASSVQHHLLSVYRSLHNLERRGLAVESAPRGRPVGIEHPMSHSMPSEVVVDPQLAEVIGLYLAEGCVARRWRNGKRYGEGLIFAFHRKETDLHHLVISVMKDRFGLATSFSFDKPGRVYRGNGRQIISQGNTARLIVHSKILADTFAQEFLCGAAHKRVPRWLREAPRAVVAGWVRGLFKGDGCKMTKSEKWQLGIVSRELAFQTVDALRALGFRSSIADYRPAKNATGTKQVYLISVSKRGPSFDALMTHGEIPPRPSAEMWARVKKPIVKQYSGLVFNLEVEEDESYTVDCQSYHNCFGIFFARGAGGSRERMEKINVTNFEEFLAGIRGHVKSFYQLLAAHIVALNPGKLTQVPTWTPNPLNTKTEAFIQALSFLAKLGKVSFRTLAKYHGLDDSVELRRIAMELGTDTDDLFDANVPTSYVQQVTKPPDWGGTNPDEKTETRMPPTKQPGRPKKRES